MAINIYKPGQGYWTRVMSGVGGGTLVLVLAVWLWRTLSAIQADQVIYWQAGIAATVIIVLGGLVFWLVARKPRTADFLIATEGEMKKVNWPTRRELIGSTWVVICCVILLTLYLFVVDILFSTFFRAINILQ